MADLLASYNALSPSSPRTDVARVLNSLIAGAVPLNVPPSIGPTSSVIASASNLSILLTVSKNFSSSNLDASLEALRCIANTLLLIESARTTLTSDTVNGGEYAVHLLEVSYL
jgi:hypothetical protein